MRLTRIDAAGPLGEDLFLHPRLTVLLDAPGSVLTAVVAAARSLGDPSLAPPSGRVEVCGVVAPLDRQLLLGLAPRVPVDPVVELRSSHRPPAPPVPHHTPMGMAADDPTFTSRRVAAEQVAALEAELTFVRGERAVAERRAQVITAASGADTETADRRSEVEAAADQVSLALLQRGPEVELRDLEQRLVELGALDDDESVRREAIAARLAELRADVTADAGDVSIWFDHDAAIAELELVRDELFGLVDGGEPVDDARRRQVLELRVREATLLDELGYATYAEFALDVDRTRPGRDEHRARRRRAVRADLIAAERSLLEELLPDELDGRVRERDRARLRAEVAGRLGVDVQAIGRLTIDELVVVVRERLEATGADDPGIAAAADRLRIALRAVDVDGAGAPSGTAGVPADPITLLDLARRWLLSAPTTSSAHADGTAHVERAAALEARERDLADELESQRRVLGLLERASGADDLPAGVPLGVPELQDPDRDLVQRLAVLRRGGPAAPLPLVLLAGETGPGAEILIERTAALPADVQCIVVVADRAFDWPVRDDAVRVVAYPPALD